MTLEAEIRERFETAQRFAKARAELAERVSKGEWTGAAAIATALGAQLPQHQVVTVDFRRPRA